MHELHLRYLEARRVREATPLAASEVALRARGLARLTVRVRAGSRIERRGVRLTVVRARQAPAKPAEPAGV